MGEVFAVCISKIRGTKKSPVSSINCKANYGIIGDAHSGTKREVSIIDYESIVEFERQRGKTLKPGDFAENIMVKGIDFSMLKIGSKLQIGDVILEIIEIGKKEHTPDEISKVPGFSIMWKKGLFCKILTDGIIKPGDNVKIL